MGPTPGQKSAATYRQEEQHQAARSGERGASHPVLPPSSPPPERERRLSHTETAGSTTPRSHRTPEPNVFVRDPDADAPDWLYEPSTARYLLNGLVAGLIAAAVLGIILQAFGVLGLIVDFGAGVDTLVGAWFALLVVHALFGLGFGLVLATVPRSRLLTGALFGMGVWLVWGLVATPIWLGQAGRVLDFSDDLAWMMLIGYAAYAFVLGLVAWWMEPRDDLREVRGFQGMATR